MSRSKKPRVVTGTAKYEVVPKVLENECFAASMWLVCGLFLSHSLSVSLLRVFKLSFSFNALCIFNVQCSLKFKAQALQSPLNSI